MKKTFLAIIVALSAFYASQAYAGFGISPPSLANKNLVPGSFYQQEIYLVQSDPNTALNVTAKIDAPEIASWIKIENGNNFQIPKGKQQFPMKVSVTVPSDAVLKKYTGRITLNTTPAEGQKSGVSVVLGAEVKIDLDVTSVKVSNFSIQSFQIPDAPKGSPIKFVMKIKNEGNVENGPTKVALAFFDQYHNKQLGQAEKNITEKVRSFSTGDISAEFSNDLQEGSYWADVKIFSEDKEVVNSKIIFNVVKGSGIQEKIGFAIPWPDFSAIPWWIYAIIACALVILGLIVAIIIILVKGARKPKITTNNAEENNEVRKLKVHK